MNKVKDVNEDVRTNLIQIIMLILNFADVLFVTFLIYITSQNIIRDYEAGSFIGKLKMLPSNPLANIYIVTGIYLLMALCFFFRKNYEKITDNIAFLTMALEFALSLWIIFRLNFNYNGVLLFVFANVIYYSRDTRVRYIFITVAIISYVLTNYDLLASKFRLFSIDSYISYYAAGTQTVLFIAKNLFLSLNIVLFILFCIFLIQEQRGAINVINQLNEKLEKANHDLENANMQLKDYAEITEHMGETKERNRLAREIHDTIGHTLTGISTGLDAAAVMVDMSPEKAKEQIQILSNVSREGLQEVRRSVSELKPDALDRMSLKHAITKLITDMQNISGVKIFFSGNVENMKFDEDEEMAIYRVIQESITNSIRHGKAGNIWVTMEKQDSSIMLKVKDDGVGCAKIEKGFGTQHIEERIRMLDGTVSFDGSDGFTVNAVIPIRWGEEYD